MAATYWNIHENYSLRGLVTKKLFGPIRNNLRESVHINGISVTLVSCSRVGAYRREIAWGGNPKFLVRKAACEKMFWFSPHWFELENVKTSGHFKTYLKLAQTSIANRSKKVFNESRRRNLSIKKPVIVLTNPNKL